MKGIKWYSQALLAYAMLILTEHSELSAPLRVCYYTNWSQYRPFWFEEKDARFYPEDIDPSLCSHIIFGFASIDETTHHLITSEWNDRDMWHRFVMIKKKYPNLKALIGVGGWSFGTERMTAMLDTVDTRESFISSAITMMRQEDFDGVNLDFEYPGSRGSPLSDKYKFTALCQEFRTKISEEAAFSRKTPLLLTTAVSASKTTIDTGYEIEKVCKVNDFVNLMSFDFNGSWNNFTGHNSPLYARTGDRKPYLNVNFAAHYWANGGCSKKKLVIGLPMYGKGFTLADPDRTEIGAEAYQPSPAGKWTRSPGFLAYYEICQYIEREPSLISIWHKEHQVPYLYWGTTWVGYDDKASIDEKVKWIKTHGFGGWLAWNLDLDDFRGQYCNDGPYPLIRQANNAWGLTERFVTETNDVQDESINSEHQNKEILQEYSPEPRQPLRMCYISKWASYRPEREDGKIVKFTPGDINVTLCSHIVFAFLQLDEQFDLIYSSSFEDQWIQMNDLKMNASHIRTILGVGGPGFGKNQLIHLLNEEKNRRMFIDNSIELLRKYNFDGLDVHFDFSDILESKTAEVRDQFTSLVQELRQAFDLESSVTGKPLLLLSAGVSGDKKVIDASYEIGVICKDLDYVNLQTFDFSDHSQHFTSHPSPHFYGKADLAPTKNMEFSARYWSNGGCPKQKLLIGLPFYGRCFTLKDAEFYGIGAEVQGSCAQGNKKRSKGMISFYEICESLKEKGAEHVWDKSHKASYAHWGSTWVGYDDRQSVKNKVLWAQRNGFAGWWAWSLDLDDFRGQFCSRGSYPLLQQANKAWIDATTLLKENITLRALSSVHNITGSHPIASTGGSTSGSSPLLCQWNILMILISVTSCNIFSK